MSDPNSIDLDPIRAQIDAYHAVDRQIKGLTETRNNLRADIEKALGDNETGIIDGKTVVTYRHSKRTSFDQAALRKDQPELFASYQRTSVVRTFRMV